MFLSIPPKLSLSDVMQRIKGRSSQQAEDVMREFGIESLSSTQVSLSPSQLSMLLEGIDWRTPQKTWRPLQAG